MSQAFLAAILAAAVVQLLVPSPTASLRRITPRPSRHRGTQTAAPLRQRVWLGVAVAALAVLVIPDPLVGVVVGALTGSGACWGAGRLQRRSPGQSVRGLPHVLQMLAVCLEAGAPVQRAVEVVRQASPGAQTAPLARVSAELALGRPPAEAWETITDQPAWQGVARDVARSTRSGTALVQLLRTHAHEVGREEKVTATRQARQVGVKSVLPLMVCFLPAFVLVGVVPIIAGLIGGFFG